jgi:hypothetical protein
MPDESLLEQTFERIFPLNGNKKVTPPVKSTGGVTW